VIVGQRLRVKGFIISDHADRETARVSEVTAWLRDGGAENRESPRESRIRNYS